LRRTFLAPNTSTSLQTTLVADAHLAEEQFLHEEQTLNKANNNNTVIVGRKGGRRKQEKNAKIKTITRT
jgi:hypothetical protein